MDRLWIKLCLVAVACLFPVHTISRFSVTHVAFLSLVGVPGGSGRAVERASFLRRMRVPAWAAWCSALVCGRRWRVEG